MDDEDVVKVENGLRIYLFLLKKEDESRKILND